MKNWFEIKFWQFVKRKIIKDYGCRCQPQDFEEDCFECQAGRVVRFIDKHIDLIKNW